MQNPQKRKETAKNRSVTFQHHACGTACHRRRRAEKRRPLRTTLRLYRTEKGGILPRVFLLLAALLLAAAGIFAAPPAQAAGAQQIRDAKLKWVTTDYDGIPERLLLKKGTTAATRSPSSTRWTSC
jgi:hypothetical protein